MFGDLLEKHVPLKIKGITIRPAAVWANNYIMSARNREIFMNQRDIVKKNLYTTKSEFYAYRNKDHAGNPNTIFQIMGSLLHIKRLPTLPKEHVGKLLDYFIT